MIAITLLGAQDAHGRGAVDAASDELLNSAERASDDAARSQAIEGTGALADNNDEETLRQTLFSDVKLGDLSAQQQKDMRAAAQRRLERQEQIFAERQRYYKIGVVSKGELDAVNTELDTRRHVMDLANEKIRLAEAQRQMAKEEEDLGRAIESGTSRKAMLKFDGKGRLDNGDFALVSSEFEGQFHYPLPVTAWGQTRTHRSLGFDHRGKIDVGLNPEGPEGLWLRRFLEAHQIPYIAFRYAVRGSATAPHIHLGTGSVRTGVALKVHRPRSRSAGG